MRGERRLQFRQSAEGEFHLKSGKGVVAAEGQQIPGVAADAAARPVGFLLRPCCLSPAEPIASF
jgi:hypothetical protein